MRYFVLIGLLLAVVNLRAQLVKDFAFNAMLTDLLTHQVSEIGVQEAFTLNNVVFLDAREEKEFNVSHIKNSIWIGYNQFQKEKIIALNKKDQIIVYCSVGYRSEQIAIKLVQHGFKNVKNLYGGIFEWKNQGFPVYDLNGKETEKVHAYDEEWGKWLTKGVKVF